MAGVQEYPRTAKGRIHELDQIQKKKKLSILGGGVLNYGLIGIDTYMNLKEGDSAPVAVGKALLTNAAFSLIPGGVPMALGLSAVAAAPSIMNALDQASFSMTQAKQSFRSDFQSTESQISMLQTGLTNMQDARTHAVRQMANHARGAQKVY